MGMCLRLLHWAKKPIHHKIVSLATSYYCCYMTILIWEYVVILEGMLLACVFCAKDLRTAFQKY